MSKFKKWLLQILLLPVFPVWYALLVPDVGEVLLLSYALNKIAPGASVRLKLFSNNYTPVEGSVIASFTEATTAGYAAITLTNTDWTVETAAGVTTAAHIQKTFTLTGAGTHYGYYITDIAGTGLLWAERFDDAPHNIPSGGGTEKITCKLVGE